MTPGEPTCAPGFKSENHHNGKGEWGRHAFQVFGYRLWKEERSLRSHRWFPHWEKGPFRRWKGYKGSQILLYFFIPFIFTLPSAHFAVYRFMAMIYRSITLLIPPPSYHFRRLLQRNAADRTKFAVHVHRSEIWSVPLKVSPAAVWWLSTHSHRSWSSPGSFQLVDEFITQLLEISSFFPRNEKRCWPGTQFAVSSLPLWESIQRKNFGDPQFQLLA